MADPQAPTEEQLADVKAQQDAQNSEWQGDFKDEDLVIPYKREDKDEPAKTDKDDSDTTDNDTDEEDKTPKVVEEYVEAEPVVTAEDPGEYTPADYSFEVTLASGKTKTIRTPEDAEAIAEDPDNFETPKQLMEFINKQNKMVSNLDRDFAKYQDSKEKFDKESTSLQERNNTVETLAKGINYLVSKGMIPKVDPAYASADWRDPEVAKQAGVKEQLALLDYMTKENAERARSGIPPLSSALDAYNAWQLDSDRKKEIADQRVAGEARKAAGARVAGTTAAQQGSFVPKGIAVGNPNVLRRGVANWD